MLGGVMAFLKSPLAGALPDVQLLFAAAPQAATPYLPPSTRPSADSFGCRAAVLRPESRGRLDLVSADPRQPMRIRQNFLATDKDWATLRAGLRMVREVARQTPLHVHRRWDRARTGQNLRSGPRDRPPARGRRLGDAGPGRRQ
jgi:4-pyridoxate dehydrogenase